jgi:hypothetical protein
MMFVVTLLLFSGVGILCFMFYCRVNRRHVGEIKCRRRNSQNYTPSCQYSAIFDLNGCTNLRSSSCVGTSLR